ncbi:poly [ADP-ribose] polymerase-like [Sitodiplosis mosellana]|uniref:poly [ADP-ribose] polymerase-like n=1 Tax=Sitodiplosis mosellana TaxID=263140 RepID=UPI002443B8FC|nr:poly [ADP-ribose] polymerase-like [Sitodiplosis mosellana]
MPTILPFRAEYAQTARNWCKKCRRIIQRDTVQIGIMRQSLVDDCLKPEWYDMTCFFKIRRPISEDFIEGFANLRYSHQGQIRYNLGYDENGISIGEQPPAKKCKIINAALEKEIEIQSDELFKIYDKLKGFNERDGDCLAILKANNQYAPDNYAETLNHLCDVLYFGALAPCPFCKGGKFVFRNFVYRCTGYDSPWSSCTHTVREPQRIPIDLPEKYQEILGTDFEVRTRILRDVTKFNEDDFEIYTKQPLFDMEFCIVGETGISQEDIEKKIEAMGGKITSKVHTSLAAVISNANEVKNYSELIKDAFIHRIQVIPDDFLNEVMENDPIEVIVKNDLTKWGKDPYERMPERKPIFRPVSTNDRPGRNYIFDPNTGDKNGDAVVQEAVLDFVDTTSNKNTYCKLQLHRVAYGTSQYSVDESMGRIGTSVGTNNRKHYTTLDLAKIEFNRIYFEKTGNEFGTTNFVKKPGLYNHVLIDNESLEVKRSSLANGPATKLSKPLYELMELLYSDDHVFNSTLIEFCFDLDSMPLGKLSKTQIQAAMNILGELSSVQCTENRQQIIALSNQFYSYFPHNFSHRRPPIIETCKMIEEKMNMLQHLLQKELRYQFLISESNQERNLLDLCYAQLEDSAEITMLNKSSGMYTQICNYINNTQLHVNNQSYYDPGAFEVNEVFEVLRHEELMRYAPYENNFNRQLLFHGSPIQNFVGILTNGLKISPPEAMFCGSIFGRGIYFSDSVSKSAGYCRSGSKGFGLVLLCEVAAGITDIRYKHDNKKLIDYCETVQALGQYYPHPLHIRPDGLKIPNGTLIRRSENTGITFNEFVVSDESRVKIRYLVKLKFNIAKRE